MHDLWMRACQYAERIGLKPKKVRVDFLSLEAALERYARDIFGCRRVVNEIDKSFATILQWVPVAKKNDVDIQKGNILNKLYEIGIRIPSNNPYVHKKCAFLLYYLTLMRPFSILPESNDDAATREKKAYFNAAVSAHIVNLVLSTVKYQFFQTLDLIRDLTLRTMSRSAMEAMMEYAAQPKP